jgi:hypothetical protein
LLAPDAPAILTSQPLKINIAVNRKTTRLPTTAPNVTPEIDGISASITLAARNPATIRKPALNDHRIVQELESSHVKPNDPNATSPMAAPSMNPIILSVEFLDIGQFSEINLNRKPPNAFFEWTFPVESDSTERVRVNTSSEKTVD